MLYFAYGSNVSIVQMLKRCPTAKVVGVDYITHYALRFNKKGIDGTGKANVEEHLNSRVHGVVYVLSPSTVAQLDQYEGEGEHYHRVPVVTASGKECEMYVADPKHINNKLHPSEEYKETITRGFSFLAIPTKYYKKIKALKTSKPIKICCKK